MGIFAILALRTNGNRQKEKKPKKRLSGNETIRNVIRIPTMPEIRGSV